jgi:hypothetical protein
MSEGIKSVVYPASDLAKAKAMFSAALNAEPVIMIAAWRLWL